jgi:hypothetical protein
VTKVVEEAAGSKYEPRILPPPSFSGFGCRRGPRARRRRAAAPLAKAARRLQFGVGVERGLVLPQFEQDSVSGSRALWNTSNCSQPASCREIARRAFIAREIGTFAGCRVQRDDEPDRA